MPPLEKPEEIVDRDAAWSELVRAVTSDAPELLFVRGRRRAGKSFLLSHFVQVAGGVYYQATRRTEDEQLAAVSRVLGEAFDDPALRRTHLASWEDVLRYCLERAGGRTMHLVLDEFPYLMDVSPALSSVIQAFWDHEARGSRLKLILCGSHVSAMRRLTEADQPLFGRRTGMIQLGPLSYRDLRAFLPSAVPRDLVCAYGIFGGLPGQLALVDSSASLRDNVSRHILAPTGRLHEEAAHAFDTFRADAQVHYSIVASIARGDVRWQRIANRVGKAGASLSRPLAWLQEMEVVERVAPFARSPTTNPKRLLYRLDDPYLRFWHLFVADLRARGIPQTLPPGEIWDAFVAPRLDEYIGRYVFEEICRQYVAGGPATLPFRPVQVGSWWSADHSVEVDVVALGLGGELLVGECKWGAVTREDFAALEGKAGAVARGLGHTAGVHLVLFAGAPIPDPRVEEARRDGRVQVIDLPMLFG